MQGLFKLQTKDKDPHPNPPPPKIKKSQLSSSTILETACFGHFNLTEQKLQRTLFFLFYFG